LIEWTSKRERDREGERAREEKRKREGERGDDHGKNTVPTNEPRQHA